MEELEEAYDEQGRKVSPLLPSTTNTRFTDLVRRTAEIEVFDDD